MVSFDAKGLAQTDIKSIGRRDLTNESWLAKEWFSRLSTVDFPYWLGFTTPKTLITPNNARYEGQPPGQMKGLASSRPVGSLSPSTLPVGHWASNNITLAGTVLGSSPMASL